MTGLARGGTNVHSSLRTWPGRPAVGIISALCLAGTMVAGSSSPAAASGPNLVAQWNKIAEDTVVASGAFQGDGLIYMAYTQAAVYDAAVAIEGTYVSYGPPVTAPAGASVDAAIVEAAYETLVNYFPANAAPLGTARDTSLAAIADGQAKTDGIAVGHQAAQDIITMRTGDGRQTPVGSTSSFPTKTPGPGVWRLTPPAYLAPQTPWVANVHPFVLKSGAQFLPSPPPSLSSSDWVTAFNELKTYGSATSTARTADETNIAKFWSANVPRQY